MARRIASIRFIRFAARSRSLLAHSQQATMSIASSASVLVPRSRAVHKIIIYVLAAILLVPDRAASSRSRAISISRANSMYLSRIDLGSHHDDQLGDCHHLDVQRLDLVVVGTGRSDRGGVVGRHPRYHARQQALRAHRTSIHPSIHRSNVMITDSLRMYVVVSRGYVGVVRAYVRGLGARDPQLLDRRSVGRVSAAHLLRTYSSARVLESS